MCWSKLQPEGVLDSGGEVKWLKESQFWKWLSLHFEDFGENIMRLIHDYLTLSKVFGYFWLKLDTSL
jgi:hypothetical protein